MPTTVMSTCRGLLLVGLLGACAPNGTETAARQPAAQPAAAIDSAAMMRDVGALAHDSMQGRAVATEGNAKARALLARRLREIGLQPARGSSYEQPFAFARRGTADSTRGVNLVARVRGTAEPDQCFVVTAHYDHVGVRNGEIFNGADDNASGSAALLQIASYFQRNPPRHCMLFALLDAEENGLQGARAFVANPPVAKNALVLNVNMDMVGRNDRGELYVAGTRHYPQLLPHVQAVAQNAEVTLIPGHDSPTPRPSDDWTNASDHGPFHNAGIPFLYFGVEDHADYHRPTDDVAGIQPGFYSRAVRTILSALLRLDSVM